MAQLTLVLGGVRSGKSRWAEHLAGTCPPVIYLATALAGDADMDQRIRQHQQRRPADWRTVEEPWDVVRAVAEQRKAGSVLVECLSLWLTNLLVGLPGRPGRSDADIRIEVEALAGAAQEVPARVIVVSNEVGCGLMPANVLARRFGDLLGEANQRLAAAAAEVYALLAGIPLRVK
jgi:adenosylcobinamide kinase / adenosylcobinamide-phosphate guanylyltransferase